jgi:hypothetical protein
VCMHTCTCVHVSCMHAAKEENRIFITRIEIRTRLSASILYKIRHSLYRSARRGVANGSAASIRILRFCGIYSAGMAGRQREAVITVKETTKQKHKTSVCFTVVWLRGIESVRRVEVN